MLQQYFPILLIVLFLVVLVILPARQRKRVQAQQQAMQDSLAIGTPIMTTSGIHGSVAGKGDTTVDVEIAPGVVVTFARQAILEVRKPAAGATPADIPGDDALPAEGEAGSTVARDDLPPAGPADGTR